MQNGIGYKLIFFIIASLFLISCEDKNMDTYQKDQINEISIAETADGSLKLTVMPILETLYACPGILLKEENDAVMVEFVRCRINANCRVDVKATTDPDSPGSYNIILSNAEKPIKINYHSGAIQVWPKSKG